MLASAPRLLLCAAGRLCRFCRLFFISSSSVLHGGKNSNRIECDQVEEIKSVLMKAIERWRDARKRMGISHGDKSFCFGENGQFQDCNWWRWDATKWIGDIGRRCNAMNGGKRRLVCPPENAGGLSAFRFYFYREGGIYLFLFDSLNGCNKSWGYLSRPVLFERKLMYLREEYLCKKSR